MKVRFGSRVPEDVRGRGARGFITVPEYQDWDGFRLRAVLPSTERSQACGRDTDAVAFDSVPAKAARKALRGGTGKRVTSQTEREILTTRIAIGLIVLLALASGRAFAGQAGVSRGLAPTPSTRRARRRRVMSARASSTATEAATSTRAARPSSGSRGRMVSTARSAGTASAASASMTATRLRTSGNWMAK